MKYYPLHKGFLAVASIILALSLPLCKSKKNIIIDGSSTVFPITEAVAEEFRKTDDSVNVSVGISGTGGGFKKFCSKETEISDASRRMKESEAKVCKDNGVEYLQLDIAFDGLSVVVNPGNTYVDKLTVADLKKIFQYDNPARTWKDVNPAWPADPIKIFSPGQDSGTYDYFVEEIIGKGGRVRADASFSEDDNVLVTGVSADKGAIGFFGIAYYEQNKDKLRVVPIVNPKTNAAITPDTETVRNGTYAPLSRPLFIYVSKTANAKPEVRSFVEFFLKNVEKLTAQTGYIPMPAAAYEENLKKYGAF